METVSKIERGNVLNTMMHVNSEINKPEYQNHQVFEVIEHMMHYYDGVTNTCFGFVPNGALYDI